MLKEQQPIGTVEVDTVDLIHLDPKYHFLDSANSKNNAVK